jgi:hypothetical protein
MKNMLIIAVTLLAGFVLAGQAAAQTPVSGTITSNTTWSSDVLLQGPVFVAAGATLTIEPGVTIYSEKSSVGALIVSRGGRLNAVGTPDNPIVVTSDQTSPARGDTGGVVINGYAPINIPGGTKVGEGQGTDGPRTFGCTGMTCTGEYLSDCTFAPGSDCNDADNSGTIRYFRIEYGGLRFTPTNEYNGIALEGVGSGTTIDHVQAYYASDDGIEFFGGSVNIKYAIATGAADDSFDWTDGWRGSAQFVVVQQEGDEADCGMECDNQENGFDYFPRSKPNVYNATVIGDPVTGTGSTRGMRLRHGTAGIIRNNIVMGFKGAGVRIQSECVPQAVDGDLVVDNNLFYDNLGGCYEDTTTSDNVGPDNVCGSDPLLGDPYDLTDPDFRPAAGSPAVDGTVTVAAPPAGNTFIVATDYIGAVDPDEDWTRQPWTTYGTASWTEPTTTTTSVPPSTTTTTPGGICPAVEIYGEGSQEVAMLRTIRDQVLRTSPEGRELVRMYYQLSPMVVQAIKADPAFKAELKELADEFLNTID